MSDEAPDYEQLPEKRLTANQLVALNLTYYRRAAGHTQEQLAGLLNNYAATPWSKTTISAAERSIDGNRVRQFDADDLVNFSLALQVPIPAFFVPPASDGLTQRFVLSGDDDTAMSMGMLLERLVPRLEDDWPAVTFYRERFAEALEFHFGTTEYFDRDVLARFADDETAADTLRVAEEEIVRAVHAVKRLRQALDDARDPQPATEDSGDAPS